jgi:hypothetical protein
MKQGVREREKESGVYTHIYVYETCEIKFERVERYYAAGGLFQDCSNRERVILAFK